MNIQTATMVAVMVATLAGACVYFYGGRWKALEAVAAENARVAYEGREVYRDRAERLANELEEQRELKHSLRSELEAERKVRDLVPILQKLSDTQETLVRAMELHRDEGVSYLKQIMMDQEERALERHTQIVSVLQNIDLAIRERN